MDVRSMMKRLREEAKAKEAGSIATSVVPAPPMQQQHVQKVTPPIAGPQETLSMPNKQTSSSQPSDNKMWSEESLFERTVTIEGGTGPGRGEIIRLLEDPMGTLAGGNGATLWDCSLALTRVLAEHYSDDRSLTGKVVLELGAGLGLVGLAMAAMGATVISTERGMALPLLVKNVEHNQGVTGGRVEVTELSWGGQETKALLADRESAGKPPLDIVVGSDLVFPSNSEVYPLLADTLSVLLNQNKKGGLELWQSHEPRRPEVEEKFWALLEDRGIYAQRLTPARGELPSSHPEDIMVYKLRLKDEL